MLRIAVFCTTTVLMLLTFLPSGDAEPRLPDVQPMVRAGRAPFDAVEDLLFNPTKIAFSLGTWREEGNKFILSETDVHAIYPYPMAPFLNELTNYENFKNTRPRVTESVLEYASADPYGRHLLRVHIDVKVLGFGAEYTYVIDNRMDRSGEGYLQSFKLSRSPDGTLYELAGSWYVEEFIYDGIPHTYVRNYAVIGVRKGNLATEIAMRTFGIWQLRQVFKGISRSAQATPPP